MCVCAFIGMSVCVYSDEATCVAVESTDPIVFFENKPKNTVYLLFILKKKIPKIPLTPQIQIL